MIGKDLTRLAVPGKSHNSLIILSFLKRTIIHDSKSL